jgi:hypothetical protein
MGAALPWTSAKVADAADGWRDWKSPPRSNCSMAVGQGVGADAADARRVLPAGRERLEGSGLQGGFRSDPVYGANMFYGEADGRAAQPKVIITSRFATRDRTVDLAIPSREVVQLNAAERELYLRPTEHIPTDGVVGATARKIMLGAGPGATDRARASTVDRRQYLSPKRAVAAMTSASCSNPAISAANVPTSTRCSSARASAHSRTRRLARVAASNL